MNDPKWSIEKIRSRIRRSIPQGGREPLLVAVSKGRNTETIRSYYDAGIRDFGESRVQEALGKIPELPKDIRWHFIGHLQSNKVKEVIGKFVLIHSVDSLKLLKKINSRAEELGLKQDLLLEVNVSGEKTKYGFKSEEIQPIVEKSSQFQNVRVLGLMTMAPYAAREEELKRIFGSLRELGDELKLTELSMGMSDDFEIAVQEGATIVRIGKALFE